MFIQFRNGDVNECLKISVIGNMLKFVDMNAADLNHFKIVPVEKIAHITANYPEPIDPKQKEEI